MERNDSNQSNDGNHDNHGNDTPRVTVRRGRRLGWWVDGCASSGRRLMYTWWPTRGLAEVAARLFARVVDRGSRVQPAP